MIIMLLTNFEKNEISAFFQRLDKRFRSTFFLNVIRYNIQYLVQYVLLIIFFLISMENMNACTTYSR